jgi:hypothetical protein
MNPDGVSYLDIAGKVLDGEPAALLNPYWSPLYPAILAIVLKFFPNPANWFPAVHLANALVAFCTLAAFTFFLRAYSNQTESLASFRARTAFAYALCLWGVLEAVGLGGANPDLCVTALVYLAAGLSYRQPVRPVLLGAVLALACFAKAAMVPLSLALLILLALWRVRLRTLAVAFATFAAILGPYVAVLSVRQHHFTFGESGRLNYAWIVLKAVPQSAGWTQPSLEAGTPQHSPRVLNTDPPVLEFSGPVSATNPLWFDPVYFHEGLQVRFDVRKQLVALIHSLLSFRTACGTILFPLLAGAIVLALHSRRFPRNPVFYWSLAAFCLYAMVVVEPRYIAPFLVLFWLIAYDTLAGTPLRAWTRALLSVTAICILFFQVQGTLKQAASSSTRAKALAHLTAARELASLGLKPGDHIATIGSGFDAYYAKLTQLQINATIGYEGGTEPDGPNVRPFDLAVIKEELQPRQIKAIVGACNFLPGSTALANSGFCAVLF